MTVEHISFYQTVTLLVSIISSVTVIMSVIFLYRQTTIFAKQAEYLSHSLGATVAESLNSHAHEISRLFVEYPTLRPYFYDGRTIEQSHPDYTRAEAIAELILDIMWTMRVTAQRYLNTSSFMTPNSNENLWKNYVEDSFAQSPILVETLMKHRDWYGKELFDVMSEGIKRHAPQAVKSTI